MAKKKGCGAGFVLLLVIGGIVAAWRVSPALGIGLVVLLVVIVGAASVQRRCGVCGSPIQRSSHHWSIYGKKVIACPSCNTNLQRRKSRHEVDRLLG